MVEEVRIELTATGLLMLNMLTNQDNLYRIN